LARRCGGSDSRFPANGNPKPGLLTLTIQCRKQLQRADKLFAAWDERIEGGGGQLDGWRLFFCCIFLRLQILDSCDVQRVERNDTTVVIRNTHVACSNENAFRMADGVFSAVGSAHGIWTKASAAIAYLSKDSWLMIMAVAWGCQRALPFGRIGQCGKSRGGTAVSACVGKVNSLDKQGRLCHRNSN
jgi:hypothetical protein